MTAPRRCRALLIAAPASGQGKTTVTAAIARLHSRAGRKVRVFKCGPDFIDPQWLSVASGHPVHNVDLWLCGEDDARARLYDAADDADLILIEGVMGLFDGNPSAADLAERFGIPVLAVIDASAMAGTFGALAHGLQHYRPSLPWAGVLANRVASAGHGEMLAEALPNAADWWGRMPREAGITLGERHLGLKLARERADALAVMDAAADALADTALADWDAAQWSRCEVALSPAGFPAIEPLLQGKTIALAEDDAFCFVYESNVQTLQALGAQVVRFSPLANDAVPTCDAVWLPGGYPELHVQALQSATRTAQGVALALERGTPVWAECGGWMTLCERIVQQDGQKVEMWGLFPGEAVVHQRLAALGSQGWTTALGMLRGHAFHYSTIETAQTPIGQTTKHRGGRESAGESIYRLGSLQASYFHPWFASNPQATAALFLPEAQA
ncbi:cobyrinate a,c-diamide synthase [Hydrogenophaga sp. 5NK40-0174]|uniref:cobyrinate a,c-diamide synthase n=1 Tax=Hydrogenophaga sp. 5NK40-0174 TaxID=3127649 RepID=UPI0033417536